jgi:hypothetical protein
MGFSLLFVKKRKMKKLIGNYVKLRVNEKKTFAQQIRTLEAQLDNNKIEKSTFERLREVLETQYYQKQRKEWTRVKDKFQNPLKS